MNETDYVALREHLSEVKPVFDGFCARHGFVYPDRVTLGRYPRVRIERRGSVLVYFNLWMECDKDGKHFERFRRDLPYELCAGAYVDLENRTRFHKYIYCFKGKPFDQIVGVLESEMEKCLPILDQWDAKFLLENGEKGELSVAPPN